MNSKENLLKATINRLTIRASNGLIKIITKISTIAEESPEKIKKEFEIFQEEVYEEANRLDKLSNDNEINYPEEDNLFNETSLQNKIDILRSKIAKLDQKIHTEF